MGKPPIEIAANRKVAHGKGSPWEWQLMGKPHMGKAAHGKGSPWERQPMRMAAHGKPIMGKPPMERQPIGKSPMGKAVNTEDETTSIVLFEWE